MNATNNSKPESILGRNVLVSHVVTHDGEWFNQRGVCVEDRGGRDVGIVFEDAKDLGHDRRYAMRRFVTVTD